jgi:protein-tyrosine phosphatase
LYLLTEFPFGVSYGYMDDMLRSLSACGYLPVVAHPERYSAIQREPRLLESWFRQGYVLQLNKGSILGSLGDDARQTAIWALDRGLAHVIASDAHGVSHRNADMNPLCWWLEDNYREDFVQLLLEENPHRLLQGESMAPVGII